MHRMAQERVVESIPTWEWESAEEGTHSEARLQDFWGPTEDMVRSHVRETCGGSIREAVPNLHPMSSDTEVRCIVCSGDSSNRIDVVMMGDGYTMSERGRFFEDMQRLTDEMFADITFRSYLPVFNIWAIHVPSVESGIGYNSRPKNTPFQLYKQGTQHRGVLYTSSGQSKAREICRLAPGCDYPSLIGNDEFYGGLGGEFVIGTRSKTTGTVVLRHEMGHNFVYVGEEYDNGGVYRGVNSDKPGWFGSTPSSVKWQHWLTEPNKPLVEQRQRSALAKYPWADLSDGEQTFSFSSDGTFQSWKLTFTVSGFPEQGSLKVFLDGEQLPWSPSKPLGAERPDGSTVDRQFYHFNSSSAGFAKGSHTLSFKLGFAAPSGSPVRQLCSISLYEFGSESEFNQQPGYVGLFPTWNTRGSKTYRPTNEQCLMRDMESPIFCPVCREGMWLQFFQRMQLIDAVEVHSTSGVRSVALKAVPLAHLRKEPVPGLTESYTVEWKRNGAVQSGLGNQWQFNGTSAELSGNWVVTLKYSTSEVRKDPQNLLTSTKSFTV